MRHDHGDSIDWSWEGPFLPEKPNAMHQPSHLWLEFLSIIAHDSPMSQKQHLPKL